MTRILFKDAAGAECAPPVTLPPGRRKVSTIARRHVRRDVPFIISHHKPWTPLAPSDDTVLFKKNRKDVGARTYDRTIPDAGDTLVVTYLPRGGRGSQSAMKIAVTVASLALMITAPGMPWAGPLLQAVGQTALAVIRTTAALVIAGSAIASIFMRPKGTTPIYGVQGGGNAARANSPIPVGYGRCWRVPELSQPDYSRFENREDTILFKRMVVGQGKYRLKTIRVGTTTFWSGDIAPNGGVVTSGITSPFPNCKFEFLNGQASVLVPSNVITSPNVTGQNIPLSTDPNPILGPFVVNPVGTTINRLQVDYSTPGGYSRNGHETTQDLWFEYAPVDDAGTPTAAWQTLYRTTAPFFADKHLRFSQTITVPEGRYAVRARNNRAKISNGDNCNYAWDGLRGYEPDPVVREGITEVAMEIRSSKSLGITSFADVQVEVERIGQVWNGTAFVEGPIRKCLDCYVDIVTDDVYGIGEDPALVDLSKVHAYKTSVTEFDTFDGFINGPVSAWDACSTVLLPMRAEPTRVGGGYSFTRDEPSALRRHIFTRRQIVKGSTRIKYQPQADDGTAHHIIKFDDGGDYRRPNSAEHHMGSASRTPISMRVEGISSYAHAMHIARWLSAAAFYRRKMASFTTELDGRLVRRGDAVGVDVWFVNATMVGGVRSFSGTTLEMDVDMPIAAGHHAVLRDRRGREWGPVAVTQGASLRQIVLDPTACALEEADTGQALADVIGNGRGDRCAVRIGLPARLGEQFLVRGIAPQSKSRVNIDALVDSPSVYTAIDAEIPPDSPLTWGLLPNESPAVTALTAQAVNHTSMLMVRWSVAAEAGATNYQVEIGYGTDSGAWEPLYQGASPVGTAPLRYLETGADVYVRARAFGATGVPGAWAVSDPFTTPKPIVTAEVPWSSQARETQDLVREAYATAVKTAEDFRSFAANVNEGMARLFNETREQRTVIEAQVGDAFGRIEEVRTVAAGETAALALRMDAVEAGLGDITGRVETIEGVYVTTAGVTALITTALTARFGAVDDPDRIEAVVEQIFNVTVGPSGASALWSVQLDVGGRVTGLKNMNDGTTSAFVIRADIFGIENPDTEELSLYYDTGTNKLVLEDGTIIASVFQGADGKLVIDATAPSIEMFD